MAKKGKRSKRAAAAPRRGGGGFARVKAAGHRAAKSVMKEANLLEMLLFGAGGYLMGGVLDSLGVGAAVFNLAQKRSAPIASAMNTAQQSYGIGGGSWVNKVVGTGVFAHSLYRSRTGTISKGVLNAELPYAIGALMDPDPEFGGGSTGGYW